MHRKNKIFTSVLIYIAFSFLVLITFSCGKEVSRSPIEPEVPKGFIYIDSEPQGFTIFQNGRNTGRSTPDSISYIEAGQYDITLKKKYFKDTTIVVNLPEDQRISLSVNILANPSMYGNLNLQSIPEGAAITLNDSALNQVTPLYLQNLLPGEYNIKYDLFNHRSLDFIAIVRSSDSTGYIEELRDTSVWVDYQIFNSGIPTNSLTAIAVDDNNIKWIGTLANGLIKFDELNFINFNKSNSPIPANEINCISIDNQNRVWVGTDFGLGIFDGNSWTVYNRNNSGLTSEIINSIKFADNDFVWIGTTSNLVKFDGINWTRYIEPAQRNWLNDIYIENSSKIWLGTKLDGIFLFESELFVMLDQPVFGYPSETISSIDDDNLNNIWFCFLPDTAGRGGVSYWDGNIFNNFLIGSFENNVNHIFIDNQNNKWISTTEGFVQFDALNNSTLFNTLNSLITNDNVRASVRDQNGNVWITTIGGGLNKYKPPQ